MLQSHSFLWHYLWLGPNVLQAAIAVLLWRRGLHRQFPLFFAYLIFGAFEQFTLYGMDVLPAVSAETFWLACCAGLVLESALKIGVVGELFFHLLRTRPTIREGSIR